MRVKHQGAGLCSFRQAVQCCGARPGGGYSATAGSHVLHGASQAAGQHDHSTSNTTARGPVAVRVCTCLCLCRLSPDRRGQAGTVHDPQALCMAPHHGTSLATYRQLWLLQRGSCSPCRASQSSIGWLKANNIRRVAVSNAPKPNVEAMLKAIHLEDFFEDIMLGENFEQPKPFPDPYLAGLKIVGCQKDEVVIFEDSPAGASA